MNLYRPGLLIGGGLLTATGILFMELSDHWFGFIVMVLGLLSIGLAFMETSGSVSRPDKDLQTRLSRLDRLHTEGILTDTEHGRARKRLLEQG